MLDEGLLEGLKGWRQVQDESAKENKERKVIVSSKVNLGPVKQQTSDFGHEENIGGSLVVKESNRVYCTKSISHQVLQKSFNMY